MPTALTYSRPHRGESVNNCTNPSPCTCFERAGEGQALGPRLRTISACDCAYRRTGQAILRAAAVLGLACIKQRSPQRQPTPSWGQNTSVEGVSLRGPTNAHSRAAAGSVHFVVRHNPSKHIQCARTSCEIYVQPAFGMVAIYAAGKPPVLYTLWGCRYKLTSSR